MLLCKPQLPDEVLWNSIAGHYRGGSLIELVLEVTQILTMVPDDLALSYNT